MNKIGIITTSVRTKAVMPIITRVFMGLVSWATLGGSLGFPGRSVLEDYFFQRALNFCGGWIDGTGILVRLSFFDGLASRVDDVLPGNRGLVQSLSAGVRLLQGEV